MFVTWTGTCTLKNEKWYVRLILKLCFCRFAKKRGRFDYGSIWADEGDTAGDEWQDAVSYTHLEEEDFALFLTSIRHAAAVLLERTENAVNAEDLSSVPDLKEYRFRIQAKLFEYLSMQYVNPLLVLDSLMKPESTDRKGQRIYRVKAFLAAEAASPEGRLIASLQSGEYLFPKAFHGNQIQLMNKDRCV